MEKQTEIRRVRPEGVSEGGGVRETQEAGAGAAGAGAADAAGRGSVGTMTGSAVIGAYLAAVRDLPHVVQVLVDDPDHPYDIWTIISAPPFETGPRYAVYDAQLAAMQAAGHPAIDWHLANEQELTWDLPTALASSLQRVYSRS